VVSVREIGRFPETPYLFEIDEEGNYQIDSTVQREIDMAQTIAQAELRRRLRLSPEKRVSVYVHGVQTHFDDFLIDVAKAWHFEGRLSVPIAYAWPAGGRGLLSAYAYDRESGEFTVPHLKQLFRGLARIPEIEAVNVYAHSRGTDVALTALRQVVLEALAAGTDARAKYKLENIVLVAPDLDLEVAQQRFSADGLGLHVGRITLYANRDDTAIAAAQGLFSSRARVGSIRREQLSEHQLELLRRTRNVDLILYAGTNAGGFGHGYFRNSVVQADAILLVRDGRAPGVEHGRPLVPLGPPFWEIDDEYLR
jgi:esterase/lipase superfamily enzyme